MMRKKIIAIYGTNQFFLLKEDFMKLKTIVSLVIGTVFAAGAYVASVFAGGAWKEVKEAKAAEKTEKEQKEDVKQDPPAEEKEPVPEEAE